MPTDTIYTSRILLAFLVICLLLFPILAFFFLYLRRAMFLRRSCFPTASGPRRGRRRRPRPLARRLLPHLHPLMGEEHARRRVRPGMRRLPLRVPGRRPPPPARRLWPRVPHRLHQCIDVWLMSHTTCPYCRHQLNPAEKKPSSLPEVRIVVAEAADGGEALEETSGGREEEERRGEEGSSKRMVRSNSAGHWSLGREDRYTLKLPDEMRERIATERNSTGSCIDFRHLFGDHDDADRQIGGSGLSEDATAERM